MQELGLPLLLHGEVTDPGVHVFDREAVFIERIRTPLLQRLPYPRDVLEHITMRQAAELVSTEGASGRAGPGRTLPENRESPVSNMLAFYQ